MCSMYVCRDFRYVCISDTFTLISTHTFFMLLCKLSIIVMFSCGCPQEIPFSFVYSSPYLLLSNFSLYQWTMIACQQLWRCLGIHPNMPLSLLKNQMPHKVKSVLIFSSRYEIWGQKMNAVVLKFIVPKSWIWFQGESNHFWVFRNLVSKQVGNTAIIL